MWRVRHDLAELDETHADLSIEFEMLFHSWDIEQCPFESWQDAAKGIAIPSNDVRRRWMVLNRFLTGRDK